MRVGIIGVLHESNTFVQTPTTLESFRQGVLASGEEVRTAFGGSHHEIGGFFGHLDEAGVEAVPIFAARATPSGVITDDTVRELMKRIEYGLDRAGELDGLLLAPHGAAVSEPYRDFDGHWLSVVRDQVGADVPIISTLDPHACLSDAMIAATDAIIAYRTNPHLDQRERGVEAAKLVIRTIQGEVKPTQAAAMPPVAINIERQNPSAAPCKQLYDVADEMLAQPGVLSNSIILGFPYADVAEMGSACVVVTDNDLRAAKVHADRLAYHLITHRNDFVGQFISVEDAVATATKSDAPVLLLDMGDNVGGGSPGDGTLIAHALHQSRIGPSFVCLFDPQAVMECDRAGAGKAIDLTMGGRHDPSLGHALKTRVTVRSLHDGQFTEPQPRHGGHTSFDMGRTAVVETDSGLTVMLTSRRVGPSSLRQLPSCGLEPGKFRVLVAKGVHAPVAAYAPVCKTLIRVNTPGPTSADMLSFTYDHRRRPLFPFEPIG